MAGQICFGQPLNNAGAGRISATKAYAEGALFRVQGTALAFPKTGNPHETGSLDADTWDNGWDLAESLAGTTDIVQHGCLAPLGVVLV